MMQLTIHDALAALGDRGETYLKLFAQPALDIALYKPDRTDPQTPHRRDEIYVIATGSGSFVQADETRPFGPGDLLFVPKGVPHRFENFTADFSTWVIFFGEVPAEPLP
ncbi:MAG: cupin protein [Rhodospirillales bacterium]|jgi:gentisate 1,2-dioxygenase|nr:cupin protein [Rhodospirillales bacterium]